MNTSKKSNRIYIEVVTRAIMVVCGIFIAVCLLLMDESLLLLIPCIVCAMGILIALRMLTEAYQTIVKIVYAGNQVTFESIRGEQYTFPRNEIVSVEKSFFWEYKYIFKLKSGEKLKHDTRLADLVVIKDGADCSQHVEKLFFSCQ